LYSRREIFAQAARNSVVNSSNYTSRVAACSNC